MFCYKISQDRDNKKWVYIWLKNIPDIVIKVLKSAKMGYKKALRDPKKGNI